MNERIRELAKQAGIAMWGNAVFMYDVKATLDSTVVENFVELIVQKCAEVAGRDVGHLILEHFGIE